MAIHKDLTGGTAVHPFFYPSETDPTSTLGAHKGWVKMSTGELKIRNAANTAWIDLKTAVDLAAHLADTVGAHAASAISVLDTAGYFAGTEVETVLAELYDTVAAGSTPDATETVKGKAEIATQTETNTGTDDTRIVTPLKLAGRTSTDTRAGVIEIATQTETDTGTDDARAVTPAKIAGRGFERTANKNAASGYPGLGASPGTPDGTKFLRDDGTWQSVTGGGGGSVPDATETLKGIAEIATQTETNTGTDDGRIVTPLKLAGRTATETRAGVLEIATQTETNAGTDDTVALTPKKLKDYYGGLGVGGGSIYGYTPPWVVQSGAGSLFGAWGDGNPSYLADLLAAGQNATPNSFGTASAALVAFRLPKNLAVTSLYFFSTGSVTGGLKLAIYRASDGAKLFDSGAVNSTANAWTTVSASFSLVADTSYWMAAIAAITSATSAMRVPTAFGNTGFFGANAAPLGGRSIGIPTIVRSTVAVASTFDTTLGTLAGSTSVGPTCFLEGTPS